MMSAPSLSAHWIDLDPEEVEGRWQQARSVCVVVSLLDDRPVAVPSV